MKDTFTSQLHSIPQISKKTASKLFTIINTDSKFITYNQIMTNYLETPQNELGIIFICNEDINDSYIFTHMPLFCNHFKIILKGLPKGSKNVLEKIFKRKYVFFYGVLKKDLEYEKIMELIY